MVHTVRKTLADAGDKVSDGEKESIEAAIKELEEALAGSDKDDIEAKTQKLTEASSEMAQKMYADQAEQAQQAGGEEAAQSGSRFTNRVLEHGQARLLRDSRGVPGSG